MRILAISIGMLALRTSNANNLADISLGIISEMLPMIGSFVYRSDNLFAGIWWIVMCGVVSEHP